MHPLPEHGLCFVCGTENEYGLGVQWYAGEDGRISGQVTLTERQQGPPHHAHGGASAALLDDAMGSAVWHAGHMVMAVNLNVNFRRPVPLDVPVQISAHVDRVDGRKVYAVGQLCLPDGSVAVESTGIFVEVPDMIAKFIAQDDAYLQQRT